MRLLTCTLMLCSLAAAAERDAVINLQSCTGFIVHGNLLVTAKHCDFAERMQVEIGGESVEAVRVHEPSGDDGPVVYLLDGGPYPSLTVASVKPEPGDSVRAVGYPSGRWSTVEGEMIAGISPDTNVARMRLSPGISGGPLLNADGEVIGVCLWVDTDIRVAESGFAGWGATTKAVTSAANSTHRSAVAGDLPEIIVFTSPACGPCRQLKRDWAAGHFPGYRFRFVEWNSRLGAWTDPELYDEFLRSARPTGHLAFPTIWIRGTASYRVGYDTDRRPGLIGWLAGGVVQIGKAIFGSREPRFPAPVAPLPSTPVPDPQGPPEPAEPEPTPVFPQLPAEDPEARAAADEAKTVAQTAVAEVSDVKAAVESLVATYNEFREAGVIGKVRLIDDLRTDTANVKQQVSEALAAGNKVRENPWQLLWGLPGIISGLLHRRFAS